MARGHIKPLVKDNMNESNITQTTREPSGDYLLPVIALTGVGLAVFLWYLSREKEAEAAPITYYPSYTPTIPEQPVPSIPQVVTPTPIPAPTPTPTPSPTPTPIPSPAPTITQLMPGELIELGLDRLEEGQKTFVIKAYDKLVTFLNIIIAKSRTYTVPIPLICAVIVQESSVNPDAIGYDKKSYGLMQLVPDTARQMGFAGKTEDLFNPDISVEYGTKYLRWQLNRYGGVVKDAIAAYNTGTVWRRRLSDNQFVYIYQTYDWNQYGEFKNQFYVNKVYGFYELFKQTIQA